MLIASKVNRGQISTEEANAEMAQFQAGVVADSEQAATERQQAAAANMATSALMLSAAAALTQAGGPAYTTMPAYHSLCRLVASGTDHSLTAPASK